MLTIDSIRDARQRMGSRIHLTPAVSATLLGRPANVALFLKCESLQKTGSFKVRGVLNKLDQLDEAARTRGVVAVSAGNHAQALAWGARAAGIQCTVVMPTSATQAKVDASRGYGAEVIQFGASSIEAFAKAHEVCTERGATFVHPFDDAAVASGAGTVGLEILEQVGDIDAVVVPIGGGGLIAGIATAVKALAPTVKVFGVEPAGAAAMRRSLDAGHAVQLDTVQTIADGLAAPMAGELTYAAVARWVDDVVVVSDAQITDAMGSILVYTKLLAEAAGATATAAILAGKLPLPTGSRVVSVLSGGNVDIERLKAVL